MKHSVEISQQVELVFDVLEPMEVGGTTLPLQIDIREVLLEVIGPAGKARKVNIVKSISEDQILLWEDEILDAYVSDPEE